MSANISPQSPHWADKLLEWFCPDDLLEEVQGDLHELFEEQVEEIGERQARRQYAASVLSFIRPYILKQHTSLQPKPPHTDMIRNYLIIVFRNLRNKKVYNSLNLFGLVSGCRILLTGLMSVDGYSSLPVLPFC